MKAVVIDAITGIILNVIIADPSIDVAPKGTILVPLAASSIVDDSWEYKNGSFVEPRIFAVVDAKGNVTQILKVRASQNDPKMAVGFQLVPITKGQSASPLFKWNVKDGFIAPLPEKLN